MSTKTPIKEQIKTYIKSILTLKLLLWKLGIFVVLAIVIITADMLVKNWARQQPENFNFGSFLFLKFIHIENPGIAFSAFKDNPHMVFVLPTIIEIACITAMFFVRSRVYYGFITAIFFGGLCNIISRAQFGTVTDMFGFTFWPQFAIFNVADMFVDVAAVALCITIVVKTIMEYVKEKNEAPTDKDLNDAKETIEQEHQRELEKLQSKAKKGKKHDI